MFLLFATIAETLLIAALIFGQISANRERRRSQVQVEELMNSCKEWEVAYNFLKSANDSLQISFDTMSSNFNKLLDIHNRR